MELIDVYCFYIYIINAFQPASLAGWDPCWWEGLWMKQRFYLTSPAWRPDGRLECSQGDGADLFICPSCILLEYHLPSHPLFKGWEQLLLSCTLRLALSLPYLLSLSPLHPPLLPPSTHCHTFSLTMSACQCLSHNWFSLREQQNEAWVIFFQNDSCDNFVAWSSTTVKIGFTKLMPSYLVKIA